jgi:hypothetical protein
MAMRKKTLLSAAFIIFAATIFFYPVKQFSHASVLAQLAEAEEGPESAEITGNQQEPDVLPEQEEQLREEAEDPQGPYEEYVPEPGYDENQPQEPSQEYVPEPGYDENQPVEINEEQPAEPVEPVEGGN